ncbi:glycoside hydrolase family 35 protein [Streptomyces thermoalcalitolerans]|uniref:beta-galactosidase n=1 Tax=Streptomyces thermoalcalitolerans TaxID=65605 RepID=A0ABP3ZKN7_9ACTN
MALSRRSFSALAGTAVLGLALSGARPGTEGSWPHVARFAPTGPPPQPPRADGRLHTVGFDRHSLLVDGRRLVLWSGEMHLFRLPSPSLWRDVLQKMRAYGHNAVSVQVAWNYHSPAPGQYDFTGVRDLDLFLRTAAETGLYVVLRPGPRLDAGIDGGGLPGWLTAAQDRARTPDPAYLRHVDEWLGRVNAIAARHLFTRGRGTVLLYRIDDGYDGYDGVDEPAGRAYLHHLYEKVRADGIDVPLFRNDQGGKGHLLPGTFSSGDQQVDWLHGFDGPASPDQSPPVREYPGTGRRTGGASAGPRTPGSAPASRGDDRSDARGGWYTGVRRPRDAAHERRLHLTHLAHGITAHQVRTAFGGTSWGWLPAPSVPASYDDGAALDESRRPTERLVPVHQIGHMLQRIPDFARLERANGAKVPGLKTFHLRNPDTGTRVHVLRNDGDREVSSTLRAAGSDLPVTVPARDARLLVTGLTLGRHRVRCSTAQPMLFLAAGRQDVAVFCGRRGEMARVLLEYAEEPRVDRLSQQAAYVYDRGLLRVTVPLGAGGLIGVRVEDAAAERPLLLLFADEATSMRLWPYDTPSGSLLVHGPALLRTATVRGSTLHLTGDTVAGSPLEVWGPHGISRLTWNGRAVPASVTGSESLRAHAPLPGVPEVRLPELDGWRMRTENPEAGPGFDDSDWQVADRTSSLGATPVPKGQPVLFADDYGFPYGDVWYRGTFTDATGIGSVSLTYDAGPHGLLMAWLDGHPLGTHRMPGPDMSTLPEGSGTGTAVFPVDPPLRTPGRHVLSVLVRRTRHDRDGTAHGTRGAARGLAAVSFGGGTPRVRWRLQGTAAPDPVRGPLNNGGLYGEREGWHLPGFPDHDWERVGFPRAVRRQGVTWYRTTFALDVPPDVDASVGLTLDDDRYRSYRVQIFLNGWNMGQYINGTGPRRTFVLPNGILRTRGTNTLALAVLSELTTLSGPGRVRLRLLGAAAGGVPVEPVDSPGR